MITKEKILEILHSHSYNVEDQAGNHLIVVDDDSWDEVATEVKNCYIPDVSGSTFKIIPPPMTIRISDPATNEILGEFKEKEGLLTFEGKTDKAGKVFVDFICETFKQRIEHLYCH